MESEIWPWSRGFYKVYVEDYRSKAKIDRWKEAKLHCHYFYRDGRRAYDFIIPSKLYDRVSRILGLKLKAKNLNRVKSGKKAQEHVLAYRFTEMKSSNLSSEGFKNQEMTYGINNWR